MEQETQSVQKFLQDHSILPPCFLKIQETQEYIQRMAEDLKSIGDDAYLREVEPGWLNWYTGIQTWLRYGSNHPIIQRIRAQRAIETAKIMKVLGNPSILPPYLPEIQEIQKSRQNKKQDRRGTDKDKYRIRITDPDLTKWASLTTLVFKHVLDQYEYEQKEINTELDGEQENL